MTGNIIFDTTYQLDRFMEIYGKSDTKIIIDSIEASRSQNLPLFLCLHNSFIIDIYFRKQEASLNICD